jgi:hypothetical protein
MMALAFGVIPILCPATACPLGTDFSASSESCCHEPKPQQRTSCPRNTIESCPYLILEESTAATATVVVAPVSFLPVSPELPGIESAFVFRG